MRSSALGRAWRQRRGARGDRLRAFLSLRAGGYHDPTYTHVYDPPANLLKGVYYQAVAKQRFDVQSARAK